MPDRHETAAPSHRTLLARILRWRDDLVDFALGLGKGDTAVSDLDVRLRQSQQKQRQLQRRINALLSQNCPGD